MLCSARLRREDGSIRRGKVACCAWFRVRGSFARWLVKEERTLIVRSAQSTVVHPPKPPFLCKNLELA
jgi:hypothetical protein